MVTCQPDVLLLLLSYMLVASAYSWLGFLRVPRYCQMWGILSILQGILCLHGCCRVSDFFSGREFLRLRIRCPHRFGSGMSFVVVLIGQLVPVGLRGTSGVLWRLEEGRVCT
jgi:hypothetical protein